MKKHLILIFFFFNSIFYQVLDARGGGMMRGGRGGRHFGQRGAGRKNASSNRGRQMRSSYRHGGNNLGRGGNRNNFYGNGAWGGGWGGAAAWGLVGGLGFGMMTGALISGGAGRNSEIIDSNNTTIINNYNDKKDESKYKDFALLVNEQIKKIEEISNKLKHELSSIDKSHYIKKYFGPYKSIGILSTQSDNLYADGKNDIVDVAVFKGDQLINKVILEIQKQVKYGFDGMYENMDKANKDEVKELKENLIARLKILNGYILDIVKEIMKMDN